MVERIPVIIGYREEGKGLAKTLLPHWRREPCHFALEKERTSYSQGALPSA